MGVNGAPGTPRDARDGIPARSDARKCCPVGPENGPPISALMSSQRDSISASGGPVAEMPRHSFDDLVGAGEEVAGMARPSVLPITYTTRPLVGHSQRWQGAGRRGKH